MTTAAGLVVSPAVRKHAPAAFPANILYPTIYHETWWLDICAGRRIKEASIERAGTTIARMPYMVGRHLGFVTCGAPPLVHFSGPAFAPMDGPPQTRMQSRNDLTRDLIAQLPRHDQFSMKLYHGITDTLAFQREGFKTTVQFTFEVDPLPHDRLWAGIRRGHRRLIRDAEATYAIDTAAKPSEFVDFYVANIANAGKVFRFDQDLVARLIEACLARGRGLMLLARDASGVPKAGLFTMWDRDRMYNFLGTKAHGRQEASASVLLVWIAMREASERGLVFDFDGVFNAGQVQYFAGFGGSVSPRYLVTRASKLARLTFGLHGLAKPASGQIY